MMEEDIGKQEVPEKKPEPILTPMQSDEPKKRNVIYRITDMLKELFS